MADYEPVSILVYSPYFRENSLEYPGLYFLCKESLLRTVKNSSTSGKIIIDDSGEHLMTFVKIRD